MFTAPLLTALKLKLLTDPRVLNFVTDLTEILDRKEVRRVQ